MKSILTKIFSENLVKKFSKSGWKLTYGNWEENFILKNGQELVMEDDLRLIIINYPNVYYIGTNSNQPISIIANGKDQKKHVEFGFDFINLNELVKSLNVIIQKLKKDFLQAFLESNEDHKMMLEFESKADVALNIWRPYSLDNLIFDIFQTDS